MQRLCQLDLDLLNTKSQTERLAFLELHSIKYLH